MSQMFSERECSDLLIQIYVPAKVGHLKVTGMKGNSLFWSEPHLNKPTQYVISSAFPIPFAVLLLQSSFSVVFYLGLIRCTMTSLFWLFLWKALKCSDDNEL